MEIGYVSKHWTGPWARLLRAQRRGTGCRLTAAQVRRVLVGQPAQLSEGTGDRESRAMIAGGVEPGWVVRSGEGSVLSVPPRHGMSTVLSIK